MLWDMHLLSSCGLQNQARACDSWKHRRDPVALLDVSIWLPLGSQSQCANIWACHFFLSQNICPLVKQISPPVVRVRPWEVPSTLPRLEAQPHIPQMVPILLLCRCPRLSPPCPHLTPCTVWSPCSQDSIHHLNLPSKLGCPFACWDCLHSFV